MVLKVVRVSPVVYPETVICREAPAGTLFLVVICTAIDESVLVMLGVNVIAQAVRVSAARP